MSTQPGGQAHTSAQVVPDPASSLSQFWGRAHCQAQGSATEKQLLCIGSAPGLLWRLGKTPSHRLPHWRHAPGRFCSTEDLGSALPDLFQGTEMLSSRWRARRDQLSVSCV